MRFQKELTYETSTFLPPSYPLELLNKPPRPDPHPSDSRKTEESPEKERFVLIVEDEVDASEAMSEWLADEGFKSLQARHGEEALEVLHAGRRPALILLDIKMPVMDGIEFLRQISMEPDLADIPVTIVTASASPLDVPFRKKNAGFFLKPVDYERLLATIRTYCR
jgi:CheY-like chemotaxis protein